MRERNRCKKQFNKSRKLQLKTGKSTRRLLRNRAVSMRRKKVRNHFSKICNVKHSDQRKVGNLKTNKPTGHDQIPAQAVKESAEILCQPFSCLANFLFETGKVPSSWKLGEIVPVHKKDWTLTKTNYRLITILPVLSKVFKKLLHSRLVTHFEDVYHNNVFA